MIAPMQDVLDDLRAAIHRDGRTMYAIAKLSGIPASMLSRFMSRERGLSVETATKVADALGLQIVLKDKVNRKQSRRR